MPLTARPKKPAHYKKRQAGHHRQSKRYAKAYLPYLPMVLVLLCGFYLNTFWNTSAVLGNSFDLSTNRLLNDTNNARIDHQLNVLELDPQLASAAQAKANDMVANNYWSHTSPTGKTPWVFISASGYQYQAAGENLAYGFKNADDVIAGWMGSTDHRANILSSQYQAVGFGVASSPNYLHGGPATVVVAEYAEPVPSAANITFHVDNASTPQVKAASTDVASRNIARIQLLASGQAAWSVVAVTLLSAAAVALFLLRHGFRVHRLLSRGEAFVAHHPWLDFVFVLLATAGYVLTRSGGIIR